MTEFIRKSTLIDLQINALEQEIYKKSKFELPKDRKISAINILDRRRAYHFNDINYITCNYAYERLFVTIHYENYKPHSIMLETYPITYNDINDNKLAEQVKSKCFNCSIKKKLASLTEILTKKD